MSVYAARLYLPGQTKLPLNVEVDLRDETMVLKSGERHVAEWPIDVLEVIKRNDGFHIHVEGEEMLLDVNDAGAFAVALGVFDEDLRSGVVDGSRSGAMSPKARAVATARFEDMKIRIREIASLFVSDELEPSEVFAKWLRLLKDLNVKHGQGSLASDHFYELNTELLDLLPEPAARKKPVPDGQAVA